MEPNQQNKRIKVLICINNLYVGGAQRQLQKQLPYFDTKKFDITILSFDVDNRKNIDIVFPHKISHCQIEMHSLWDIRGWYKSFRLVGKLSPDVIMTSMFWGNTIGRVTGLFYRIPVIARYHNTITLSSFLEKTIDSFLARFTKKFVGVSSEVASFMVAQIPSISDHMVVVPNGIELKEFDKVDVKVRERVRSELGVDTNDTLLLTVGRLVEQKNQALMIEGFFRIKKQYPLVKLCLVGDGGCRSNLEKIVNEFGLTNSVYFVGHKNNVYPFYEAADLYISTSKIEGMSNTQLEALAHGLPIITTKTGGVAELVVEGQNGFLIKDHCSESVFQAFEKYFTHDKQELKKKSKEQSMKFDIRETVKMYENLWETIVR